MRSVLFVSALAGLAAAAPRPQELDFGAIEAIPTPSDLGPDFGDIKTLLPAATNTAADILSVSKAISAAPTVTPPAANKVKRDICTSYATGAGPVPSPDTASAFLAYGDFAASASAAASAPPAGYSAVFTNLQASVEQAGYMGVYTLDTYDASVCAAKCDAVALCESFDLYYERDPTVDSNDASCANPPSTTNIRCTLYGYPIHKNSATNVGQWRGVQDTNGKSFQVVIAGSTGFVKKFAAKAIPGFDGPFDLGVASIQAPRFMGVDTYMGAHTYETGAFDPQICATACLAQTKWDHDHPLSATPKQYMPCNMFNAYIILKNGVPQGTYCSNYAFPWDKSYATNVGQYRGSDYYSKAASYSYQLTIKDSGTLA